MNLMRRRTQSSESQPPRRPPGRRRAPLAALALAMALAIPPSALAQTVAIPRGTSWKYAADGVDLGTEWRESSYADFAWAYGPAPFGYGYPGIVTTTPYGPDSMNKYITTYFRRPFLISVNPSTVQGLTMNVNYDDGFVVYINGTEVARRSMPGGPVTYNMLAISHQVADFEAIDLSGADSVLVQGSNFMAVELHQESGSSNDLYWDADLVYYVLPTATRGPYLQVGTPNRVTVKWRTGFPTNSRVRYGTTIGNLSSTVDNATSTTEHEITLTGLTPNTRYYYSIGTTTYTIEGDDVGHTFMTSPAPGSQKPTRLWVIGDSGTGFSAQIAVRDAYINYAGGRNADIWLMLGDNAYESGTDIEYQTTLFNIYTALLKKSIVWLTRGNHDNVYAPPSSDYYGIFTMPTAGEAGGVASGTEAYYSFDYGNIHVICLDSEGTDPKPNGAMLTWLSQDLAATDKDWIIAFWHHPPYSKGSHDSDNPVDSGGKLIDMRENALPILEAGGVDLVLCGHSHCYERSMLLDGHYGFSNTLTPAMRIDAGDGRPNGDGAYEKPHLGGNPHEGAVYAVAGSSGGQVGGGTLNHPVMIMSTLDYGSMVIDVDGSRLDARFLNSGGVVRDSFRIVKGTAVDAPSERPALPAASIAFAQPNPFESQATIGYSIPARGRVQLAILDLSGRRVRTLVSNVQDPGSHEAVWDGRNDRGHKLGAGVYFSVLEYAGQSAVRKLVRMH